MANFTKILIISTCMQDYNVRIYLIYSANAYTLNTTSVRFTPRRSHCALSQTVDNPVPTIFQTAQLSCREVILRRTPRQCPVSSGSCKETGRGTRRTEERDERMKKERVVKIKDEYLRNNEVRGCRRINMSASKTFV